MSIISLQGVYKTARLMSYGLKLECNHCPDALIVNCDPIIGAQPSDYLILHNEARKLGWNIIGENVKCEWCQRKELCNG